MSDPNVFFYEIPEESGSRRLAYRQWGAPGKPKLFCVHGLTRSSYDFDALAERLAADFHLIAPDVAGRGDSDRLADPMRYGYATYHADLLALRDHLGWTRCLWLGTSMGGILGMMAAAQSPERIAALALNDIGAVIPAEGLRRIVAYAAAPPCYATRAEAEAAMRQSSASFGVNGEEEWRRFLSHAVAQNADGTWGRACDPAILEPMRAQTENFQKIDDVDLRETWGRIACPVLLLRGAESDILTREVAMEMIARPKTDFIEYPHVGHAPVLLGDDQIAPVVRWLRVQAETLS